MLSSHSLSLHYPFNLLTQICIHSINVKNTKVLFCVYFVSWKSFGYVDLGTLLSMNAIYQSVAVSYRKQDMVVMLPNVPVVQDSNVLPIINLQVLIVSIQ